MSQRQSRSCAARSLDDCATNRQDYFICALPRSGTAWLANFLTWQDSFCFHESLYGVESLDRLAEIFDATGARFTGGSDTALSPLIAAVYERFPHAKYVFVQRDVGEVTRSLSNIGISTTGVLEMAQMFWWGMTNIPNALVVNFDSLFLSTTMLEIWNHIGIDTPFPFKRFELLRNMHVEDGFASGFGRFVHPGVLDENRRRFTQLCQSCDHVSMEFHTD